MNKTLIETVIDINNDECYHLTRLIALIFTFSGRKYTSTIDGIAKITFLDFLLKYPFLLKRALDYIGIDGSNDAAIIYEDENNIESQMIAFKFGPWDFGYRKLIYILEAKNLVRLNVKGKTVIVAITDKGVYYAELLQKTEQFKVLFKRCQILKKNFGNYSLSKLSELIYTIAPEITVIKTGGF